MNLFCKDNKPIKFNLIHPIPRINRIQKLIIEFGGSLDSNGVNIIHPQNNISLPQDVVCYACDYIYDCVLHSTLLDIDSYRVLGPFTKNEDEWLKKQLLLNDPDLWREKELYQRFAKFRGTWRSGDDLMRRALLLLPSLDTLLSNSDFSESDDGLKTRSVYKIARYTQQDSTGMFILDYF